MSETTSNIAASPTRRAGFNLTGAGVVLLGVAAFIFAIGFSDKRFASEMSFPKQALGYELVSIDGQAYLLDKDKGHVWERKTPYEGASTSAWCAADIEKRGEVERDPYSSTLPPDPCR